MKTLRILALTLLMFLLPLATASADGGFTPNNIWVAVSHLPQDSPRVNLRSAPSENAPSIAKIYSGTYVWVHREAESGWAEVEVGSTYCKPLQGFIRMEYLDFARERVQLRMPTLTVANTNGGDGIMLRSSPTTESWSALGLLPNGAQVTVLAVLPGDWYFVQAGGITGYVAKLGFQEDLGGYPQPESSNIASTEAWNGPASPYVTALWPLAIPDYVGVVNNPNTADRLHLRSAPDENALSLGKYYNGVRFVINGNNDGQWIRVSIGGLEGYVDVRYITVEGFKEVPSAMPVVMVKDPGSSEGVELRQQPSAASEVLDVCMNGAEVILMGFTDDWAHVIVGEQTGFLPVDSLR